MDRVSVGANLNLTITCILCRSKTYLFEELLSAWVEKLKSTPATHMSLRLQKDIEKYAQLTPVLKYCRGDQLTADHWIEVEIHFLFLF
jgi:dynein heavy chain 2